MPVTARRTPMGAIPFCDVAKAALEAQDFENKMPEACIRCGPAGETGEPPAA